jgi:hypothetical protein
MAVDIGAPSGIGTCVAGQMLAVDRGFVAGRVNP